ncbi:MAG TPA: hypothetical protein VGI10_24800 [Polyangiaceae bacterium]|jgi:uncharacterized repeat protein (TIGR03806 family)
MTSTPHTGLGSSLLFALLISSVACSSDKTNPTPVAPAGGASGVGGASGAAGNAGSGGANAGTSGLDAGADAMASEPLGPCTPFAAVDVPMEKLSQTGCMDATNKTQLAALVIPYEVNSPLWSDSADKTRGMAVLPGKKIHVKDCAAEPDLCPVGDADTGNWVFPVGTVMVKNFMFDDKLLETRLFEHPDDMTWVGYSYQWDEAQTDATIVPNERTPVMFNTGQRTIAWTYPSRDDCQVCHNAGGGPTLGPSTHQMNRVVGGQNQIDKLSALGMFDAPVPTPYQAALVTPYPGQLGSPPAGATAEDKARSYLQANCAFCHRPDGPLPGMDMRFDVGLADMGVCDVTPTRGDEGVNNSLLIAHGQPSQSVIWLRMNAASDSGRMPPLASQVIDTAGVGVVGDWITSLTSCPVAPDQ